MGHAARQNQVAREAANGKLYSRQTIIGAMDHALEIHASSLRLAHEKIAKLERRIAQLENFRYWAER